MIIIEAFPCTDKVKVCGCLPPCPYYTPGQQNVANNSKWMTNLGAINPSIKLRDMIIPGTHDSGTWGIPEKSLCSAVARSQNFNFYQQATMGVRLFDIRWVIEGKMNEPYLFHGPFKAEKIEKAFMMIRQFMDENPNEFFLFSLQSEHPKSNPSPQ